MTETKLKPFLRDKRAIGDPTEALIGIVLVAVVLVVLFEVIPVIGYNTQDSSNIPDGATASGTLIFTGNASCGQLVNVTNRAGAVAVFRFNVTGEVLSCDGLTIPEYTMVNMPRYWNTSTVAAENLTTALNANATISGTMTVTNPSAGNVLIRYNSRGPGGNEVQISETITNMAWGTTNLSGGVALNQWSSADNLNIANGSEMWTTNSPMISVGLLIGVIAVIIGLLMSSLGGGFGKGGNGQGGAGI